MNNPAAAAQASPQLPYRGRLPEPFSAVRLEVLGCTSHLAFSYCGTEKELVACGAITRKLLKRMRPERDRKDSQGSNVWLKRSRGKCKVMRFRYANQPMDLPGFDPWMLDALHRQQQEPQQECEQDREREAAAIISSFTVLNPDEWRKSRLGFLRTMGEAVIASANRVACDHLHQDYLVHEGDRQAYCARAQVLIDELAGMLARVRIVPAAPELRRLRLVVDNAQEVPSG